MVNSNNNGTGQSCVAKRLSHDILVNKAGPKLEKGQSKKENKKKTCRFPISRSEVTNDEVEDYVGAEIGQKAVTCGRQETHFSCYQLSFFTHIGIGVDDYQYWIRDPVF